MACTFPFSRCKFLHHICLLAFLALFLSGCQAEIYQGLSETQANTMLSVLLRNGISARKTPAKSGYSVSVEESSIVQALEILKENSLPHEQFQSLGQVFSAQGMISSTTEEQARLSYAISQELSNTFSRIDGVLTSRVHVVLGQKDLATGETSSPSVAVFLRHTPDSQATRLVSSIRELASNAVPGLSQDNVSVMLVPVRENISVPMTAAQGDDKSKTLLLFWSGCALFGISLIGLIATVFLIRRRDKKENANDAK